MPSLAPTTVNLGTGLIEVVQALGLSVREQEADQAKYRGS